MNVSLNPNNQRPQTTQFKGKGLNFNLAMTKSNIVADENVRYNNFISKLLRLFIIH